VADTRLQHGFTGLARPSSTESRRSASAFSATAPGRRPVLALLLSPSSRVTKAATSLSAIDRSCGSSSSSASMRTRTWDCQESSRRERTAPTPGRFGVADLSTRQDDRRQCYRPKLIALPSVIHVATSASKEPYRRLAEPSGRSATRNASVQRTLVNGYIHANIACRYAGSHRSVSSNVNR
jgi:hypothetical protein